MLQFMVLGRMGNPVIRPQARHRYRDKAKSGFVRALQKHQPGAIRMLEQREPPAAFEPRKSLRKSHNRGFLDCQKAEIIRLQSQFNPPPPPAGSDRSPAWVRSTISTRLFLARPSSVSLDSAGAFSA